MTQIKFTGIKQAVGDFNRWQGPAIVYLDKSDGTVWTDIFTSAGSYNQYRSSSIVQVYAKAFVSMAERDDKISMAVLKKEVEICYNSKDNGLDDFLY